METMKKLQLADLHQVFSFLQSEKPVEVWAVSHCRSGSKFFNSGISHDTLESITTAAEHWVGWTFDNRTAYLLFENSHDALIAAFTFGEISD